MGRTDGLTDGQGGDYMLPRNFSGSIKRVISRREDNLRVHVPTRILETACNPTREQEESIARTNAGSAYIHLYNQTLP